MAPPRYPFRPVPHEPNILVSAVVPRNILEVAQEMEIADVVVFPWSETRHEPDYPWSFEYRCLPGIVCEQGWNQQYFRDEMHDIINWMKVRVNSSENRKVLLIDDSGGRSGAALVLLCFLTTERLHSFDSAVELIETHVLRAKIQVPEWFLDWARNFYFYNTIPLQVADLDTFVADVPKGYSSNEPNQPNIKWFKLNSTSKK